MVLCYLLTLFLDGRKSVMNKIYLAIIALFLPGCTGSVATDGTQCSWYNGYEVKCSGNSLEELQCKEKCRWNTIGSEKGDAFDWCVDQMCEHSGCPHVCR